MASSGLPAQAKACVHGFLWASKLAVCQPCNAPNFQNPTSMASYGLPAQAKATPRLDPLLFLGGPAFRSPGICSQRASQGHFNGFLWTSSAGKSYPKARSIAFSGRSSVPLARHSQRTGIPRPHPWLFMGVQACRLPARKRSKRLSSARRDPLLFLGGPACRSLGIRSQRASQGGIPRPHQWLLMGLQRRQKLPHCKGKRPRQRSISSGLFSVTGRQFRSWQRHNQLPFEGTICPAVPWCFGVEKCTCFSLLAGLWNLFYRHFGASKWATTELPFEKLSVLHCHAVKTWRGCFFPSWQLL